MFLIDTNVISEARKARRAITQLHDLTVVTRNSEDFAGTGVRLLNPFAAP